MPFKLRLLPAFIFFAVLTLTVKANSVFDSLKQNAGGWSVEASRAFASSHGSGKAEKKDAKPGRETDTAALDSLLEASDDSHVPASAAPAGSTYTQSEIILLQELAERREALDLRARDIDRKTVQLKLAEEEIGKKLKQLQAYEARLNKMIDKYDEKEKAKIANLVKLYSTMKPKEAARIFDTLDIDIIVSLLQEMKPASASAILAQIDAKKAKAVTDELVGNNFFNGGADKKAE